MTITPSLEFLTVTRTQTECDDAYLRGEYSNGFFTKMHCPGWGVRLLWRRNNRSFASGMPIVIGHWIRRTVFRHFGLVSRATSLRDLCGVELRRLDLCAMPLCTSLVKFNGEPSSHYSFLQYYAKS